MITSNRKETASSFLDNPYRSRANAILGEYATVSKNTDKARADAAVFLTLESLAYLTDIISSSSGGLYISYETKIQREREARERETSILRKELDLVIEGKWDQIGGDLISRGNGLMRVMMEEIEFDEEPSINYQAAEQKSDSYFNFGKSVKG